MSEKFQGKPGEDLLRQAIRQYDFPSTGRIREEYMQHTEDGRDLRGEVFTRANLRGDEAVVEIGFGDGLDMVRLATQFKHHGPITGIEIPHPLYPEFEDRFYYLKAMGGISLGNIHIKPGYAEAIPLPDSSIDFMYGFGIAYHVDLERFLNEARRTLKPGGLVTLLNNAAGNKPEHHRLVSEIGHHLQIEAPAAFSAKLNYETMALQAAKHMKLRRDLEVYQASRKATTSDNIGVLTASIDSYRRDFAPYPRNGWEQARKEVVIDSVTRQIEEQGAFYDWIERGAVFLENS